MYIYGVNKLVVGVDPGLAGVGAQATKLRQIEFVGHGIVVVELNAVKTQLVVRVPCDEQLPIRLRVLVRQIRRMTSMSPSFIRKVRPMLSCIGRYQYNCSRRGSSAATLVTR